MTSKSLPQVSDVITNALRQSLTGLRVALPGIIQNYNPVTGSATIQPAVGDLLQNGSRRTLGVISNVPIVFPQTQSCGMTFPLLPGDPVLLIFSDRSLEEWQQQGRAVIPMDMRSHTLTDAFAIPGVQPFSNNISNDNNNIKMRFGNSQIALSKDGKMILQAGSTDLIGEIISALSTLQTATVDPGTNMFIVPVQNAIQAVVTALEAINGFS